MIMNQIISQSNCYPSTRTSSTPFLNLYFALFLLFFSKNLLKNFRCYKKFFEKIAKNMLKSIPKKDLGRVFKQITWFAFAMFPMLIISLNQGYAKENNQPILDLYRSKQITVDDINKKFSKEIKEARDIIKSAGWSKPAFVESPARLNESMEKILRGIADMGDFSYLSLGYVIYPDGEVYFTIDVVDKQDKQRLSYFMPEPKKTINDPDHLLAKWTEYDEVALNTFTEGNKLKEKGAKAHDKCPVYHCDFGFDDPGLKKYEQLFNSLVPKNKKQLIEILRSDMDENKRANAAFLLSHIKNGQELVKILIPSIYDSSANVRNNVMRVLGATLEKVVVTDFPIDKIIIALDFPQETDRNKALYIAESLASQPKYAKYIAEHAGKQLLDELKMLQPNLHGGAYMVLKKISGKEYGERDYKAWQDWLDQASK